MYTDRDIDERRIDIDNSSGVFCYTDDWIFINSNSISHIFSQVHIPGTTINASGTYPRNAYQRQQQQFEYILT